MRKSDVVEIVTKSGGNVNEIAFIIKGFDFF